MTKRNSTRKTSEEARDCLPFKLVAHQITSFERERCIDVGEVVDAILGGDVVGAGQVGQVVAVAGQGC